MRFQIEKIFKFCAYCFNTYQAMRSKQNSSYIFLLQLEESRDD